MKNLYRKFVNSMSNLKDLPLFFIRLILAYGFYKPAIMKVKDFDAIAAWFASMNYPFPKVNAYLAGITEFAGVFLLIFGIGTRIISIQLMIVMLVAIFTVHFENGFAAGDNGFEIPLYYFLMLLTLTIYGSGKISLEHLLEKRKKG